MNSQTNHTKNAVYRTKYTKLIRVQSVRPLEKFKVHFTFTDGTERDIDLDKYLWGPVFEPVRNDPDLFRAMYVEGGTITWPGEVDIDPDTLYYGDKPVPWMVEYEEWQKEQKARQVRERRLKAKRASPNGRRKTTKAPAPKKRTPKSRARRVVGTKSAAEHK
ncbi:MAG: DUF2442 domain-containing protein [Chloroflexi bacterium]|nr:DUF2442 domain-containing protein [Chloroflexota bacterium]